MELESKSIFLIFGNPLFQLQNCTFFTCLEDNLLNYYMFEGIHALNKKFYNFRAIKNVDIYLNIKMIYSGES